MAGKQALARVKRTNVVQRQTAQRQQAAARANKASLASAKRMRSAATLARVMPGREERIRRAQTRGAPPKLMTVEQVREWRRKQREARGPQA